MGEVGSTPPRMGEILAGKYRIERVLGAGGMGTVVAAMHLDLHELRAVKLMHPESVGDARAVERFLREARAAVRLKSDHVTKVFDVGRLESGAPYIVMEHLVGSDLGQLSKLHGPLPIEDAALYVAQAASAIAEAHAAGIVHRDLKPSNLFLTTAADGSPRIKVLDFGISKMSRMDDGAPLDMTRTRELLGSPLYMAPEQMRSMHAADARSDIWGLGVILYKLVTGKLPFFAKGLLEICTVVLEQPIVRPSTLRPDLPPELEAVILHCLAKDPAKRLASAAALAASLAPFVTGRASAEPIPVELLEEPESDPHVAARTTPFYGADVGQFSVEPLDEPEVTRAPLIPEPSSSTPPSAKVRGARPRRPARAMRRGEEAPARPSRRRGPMSIVAAMVTGLFGSALSIAAGGTLVSRHHQLDVARAPAHAPEAGVALPSTVSARAQPAADAPRPEADSRRSLPKSCNAAWTPSPGPGSPDDPFQIFERSSR
jgi:serine/threonine-protein kinase